jgi:hypothetical protein
MQFKAAIKIITIFTFISYLSLQVQAQEKFEPGYIITLDRDTIFGQVRDRKNGPFARIYTKVRFKSEKGLITRRYSPAQVAGYKRGDEFFESLWIKPDGSLLQTRFISNPRTGKQEFLKVIVKGRLTCYHKEYFDHDSGTTDHISLFKRENEDFMIRATQGIFGLRKKSLGEYFFDCPELVEKIKYNEFKTPEEIALYYNLNCIQTTEIVIPEKSNDEKPGSKK